MRVAILDDYQNTALASADWSLISGRTQIEVFTDHLFDEDEIVRRLQDFEIICAMRERTPFTSSLIERLPKLKLIVSSGMRNRGIDVEAAKRNNIFVCGTKSMGKPTAELAWGLILALARKIPAEDTNIRAGGWQQSIGECLTGKTLGIAGLGNLGSRMAKIAKAFDMKVIAWSENLTKERCDEFGVELADKEGLLLNSDFLTIHLILSDRTRGMFKAEDLSRMKSTAYIINTARGPIIDEDDLINALKNKTIAGAGIDVFSVEPLPVDHPFRHLKNTVITPHLGYVEANNYGAYFKGYVEAIDAFLKGNPKNFLGGY
ncbi:MAG: hydroxyacid dehydrogenase [Rhodospirillaceae bacterium]|nr:hydroxyacid dehydrogenase [Rhodospirillaceae bacterium]